MHSIKPARFSHRLKWVAAVFKPLSLFLLLVVRTYQYLISPLLPPACRYAPTCSEYACEAIHLHGPVKGVILAGQRLLRCHPWGGSGVDPVPSLSVKKKVRSL